MQAEMHKRLENKMFPSGMFCENPNVLQNVGVTLV